MTEAERREVLTLMARIEAKVDAVLEQLDGLLAICDRLDGRMAVQQRFEAEPRGEHTLH